MSQAKRAAGRRAADQVQHGMRVGLGTGSTVFFTLERLGERVRQDNLSLVGVPTSLDTERKALEFGLELASLEQVSELDLTIDGADEIDQRFDMIKGGGGALLREKVVASISRRVLIVVDPKKRVQRLGLGFLLPVEVVPFARASVRRALEKLGARPVLRQSEQAASYLTDNGNQILDCAFDAGIADPAALERAIDAIPGVVESGLFIGLAHGIVLGHDDGRSEIHTRPG